LNDIPQDQAIPQDQIAALATLYDRFAHALDPLSEERDEAERVFLDEIAGWHSILNPPKPSLHDFTKAVILRCKRHLSATDKPPSA